MANSSNLTTDVVVIGAGVVGLAVANQLADQYRVVIIEKNFKFGQETSSRNSEVIHSGIYYPVDSRKTKLCLRGRELAYEFCSRNKVPHLKCGKYVVTVHEEEENYLFKLKEHAKDLAVDCEWISNTELSLREPLIRARAALFFPESGIVDSHQLMGRLEEYLIKQGAIFAYGHKVIGGEYVGDEWCLRYLSTDGRIEELNCKYVVNCGGFGSAELYNLFLGGERFEHRICCGRYFHLSSKYQNKFSSLIYPVPNLDGLGIHITRDLAGMVRLGPDVDWSNFSGYSNIEKAYQVDWDMLQLKFFSFVKGYFPSLAMDDLSPGFVGVRPKLFDSGRAQKDFLIEKTENSFHLLGIESPGLTASLAIAEEIRNSLS
jgi:L-2-hydroxyglutarate oxidase LhgO